MEPGSLLMSRMEWLKALKQIFGTSSSINKTRLLDDLTSSLSLLNLKPPSLYYSDTSVKPFSFNQVFQALSSFPSSSFAWDDIIDTVLYLSGPSSSKIIQLQLNAPSATSSIRQPTGGNQSPSVPGVSASSRTSMVASESKIPPFASEIPSTVSPLRTTFKSPSSQMPSSDVPVSKIYLSFQNSKTLYFPNNPGKLKDFKFSHNLKYLNLSSNSLSSLQFDLPVSLEVLNLSYNLLTNVTIFSSKLELLNLSHNKIKSLKTLRTNNLKELYVSYNVLTKLSDFCGVNNLAILDVSYNKIQRIEYIFNDPSSLSVDYLCLKGNLIEREREKRLRLNLDLDYEGLVKHSKYYCIESIAFANSSFKHSLSKSSDRNRTRSFINSPKKVDLVKPRSSSKAFHSKTSKPSLSSTPSYNYLDSPSVLVTPNTPMTPKTPVEEVSIRLSNSNAPLKVFSTPGKYNGQTNTKIRQKFSSKNRLNVNSQKARTVSQRQSSLNSSSNLYLDPHRGDVYDLRTTEQYSESSLIQQSIESIVQNSSYDKTSALDEYSFPSEGQKDEYRPKSSQGKTSFERNAHKRSNSYKKEFSSASRDILGSNEYTNKDASYEEVESFKGNLSSYPSQQSFQESVVALSSVPPSLTSSISYSKKASPHPSYSEALDRHINSQPQMKSSVPSVPYSSSESIDIDSKSQDSSYQIQDPPPNSRNVLDFLTRVEQRIKTDPKKTSLVINDQNIRNKKSYGDAVNAMMIRPSSNTKKRIKTKK